MKIRHSYTIDDWNEAFLSVDKDINNRKNIICYYQIPKDSKILEVGCGDGLNQRAFKELGYKKIYGIDISNKLLSKVENLNCICGNAFIMPFADSTFNHVYISDFLHHIDVERLIPELLRVLKPDGIINIKEPWPGLPRLIADFLTLYILHYFLKMFYYRRIVLLFEWKEYSFWLDNCKRIMTNVIHQYHLKPLKRKKTFFDIQLSLITKKKST